MPKQIKALEYANAHCCGWSITCTPGGHVIRSARNWSDRGSWYRKPTLTRCDVEPVEPSSLLDRQVSPINGGFM